MAEQPLPAPIDLSAIPSIYQGMWVLVEVSASGQRIVGHGDDPTSAMRGHESRENMILTQVPRERHYFVVGDDI